MWNNILRRFLHNDINTNNRYYVMGRKTITRLISLLINTIILFLIVGVFYFDSCIIGNYSLYRAIIYSICTGIFILLLIDMRNERN